MPSGLPSSVGSTQNLNPNSSPVNGYDWSRGMSNNAVAAYADGEMPMSKWIGREIDYAIDVGLETQSNYDNWDMYDYDLLVSRDGQYWEATDNVYFTVPKYDTIYYLRIIGYSICRKDGYVYRCTSVCTLQVNKT